MRIIIWLRNKTGFGTFSGLSLLFIALLLIVPGIAAIFALPQTILALLCKWYFYLLAFVCVLINALCNKKCVEFKTSILAGAIVFAVGLLACVLGFDGHLLYGSNILLVICCVVGVAYTCGILGLCFSILGTYITRKFRGEEKQTCKNDELNGAVDDAQTAIAELKPRNVDDLHIECPQCGYVQYFTRKICWECGAKFQKE